MSTHEEPRQQEPAPGDAPRWRRWLQWLLAAVIAVLGLLMLLQPVPQIHGEPPAATHR